MKGYKLLQLAHQHQLAHQPGAYLLKAFWGGNESILILGRL